MLAGCTAFTSPCHGLRGGASCHGYSSFHQFHQQQQLSFLEQDEGALFGENASSMELSLTFPMHDEEATEKEERRSHTSVALARERGRKKGEFHSAEDRTTSYEEELKPDGQILCARGGPISDKPPERQIQRSRNQEHDLGTAGNYMFEDPFLEEYTFCSRDMEKERPQAFVYDKSSIGWEAHIGLGEMSACSNSVGMLVNNGGASWVGSSSEATSLLDSPDFKPSLSEPCSVLDLVVSPGLKPRCNLLSNNLLQPEFSDLSSPALMDQRATKGIWIDENWQSQQFVAAQSFTMPPSLVLPKQHIPSPLYQSNAWVDSILSEPAAKSHTDGVSTEEEHSYKPSSSSEHHHSEQQHSIDALLSGTDSGDETPSDDLARLEFMKLPSCNEGSPSLYRAAMEEGQLIDLLVACVDAISSTSFTFINHLLANLGRLASPEGSSMQRVAAYFTEGLACKISKMWPQIYDPLPCEFDMGDDELMGAFQVLNHATPFVKFAHYTANDIILQAFEGEERVHVIDFDIKQGLQWPALFQSLASRLGGPPSHVRITGIGDCKEDLQDTGDRLAEFAEAAGLPFEFHSVVDKLEDVRLWMLHVKDKEAVAVNCLFQLHKTLYDSGIAVKNFLGLIQSAKPKVVALVEQEANHNHPSFQARFVESLQYYSAVFDALDASLPPDSTARLKAERFFAREIRNVLACEGSERTERHEKALKWQQTMEQGGFQSVLLAERAVLQARLLLEMFSCKNYKVRKDGEALIFGWLEKPLLSASAWALK